MRITYIHHSCFLVETDSCYYLFDYEKGCLPTMDVTKPIFVLSSHGHHDHYNPDIFPRLRDYGMERIYAVLSDDIEVSADIEVVSGVEVPDGVDIPANIEVPVCADVLQVTAGKEYELYLGQKLTTFQSTDLGVAFLIEDGDKIIYHAGDLNDWVWAGENDSYNEQMTKDYREQIDLLSKKLHSEGDCSREGYSKELNGRTIDVAFVVLDPRQEEDYDRGLCYFLEQVPVKEVYPMHYWGKQEIIATFLQEHPEYETLVKRTE